MDPYYERRIAENVNAAVIEAREQWTTTMRSIAQNSHDTAKMMRRPCIMHSARLTAANDGWRAECGEFVAFGASPEAAMAAFDRAWVRCTHCEYVQMDDDPLSKRCIRCDSRPGGG